jgi:hypothetical protein
MLIRTAAAGFTPASAPIKGAATVAMGWQIPTRPHEGHCAGPPSSHRRNPSAESRQLAGPPRTIDRSGRRMVNSTGPACQGPTQEGKSEEVSAAIPDRH